MAENKELIRIQKDQNKIALAIGLVVIIAAIYFQISDFVVYQEITFKQTLRLVGAALGAYLFLMAIVYSGKKTMKDIREWADFFYWLGTALVGISIFMVVVALIAMKLVEELGILAYTGFACYLIIRRREGIEKFLRKRIKKGT